MASQRVDGRTTVASYLHMWLRLQRVSAKSPRTIANYEWAIDVWIVPSVGHARLRTLRAEDVDDVLLAMAEAGKSRSTMTRVRAVLSMALEQAHRRGHVERNVAALTSVPAGPRARGRSLTVHQAKDLLRTAGDDRLGALVTVGLMLGLRPGELTGLCWEDVDFDAQVLHVRRARIENPGGVVLGEPKTPKSRRSLAMPQAVREDLARHRRRQQEERRKAGSRWRERGLVFCTTVGTPIDRWSLRRHFVALTERAGLGAWQPKELRHSAVSLLSAAGVPIEQVADVTGHAGTRTILDTYRHPVQPSVDVARAVMDELF